MKKQMHTTHHQVSYIHYFLFFFLFNLLSSGEKVMSQNTSALDEFKVGVVLDMDNLVSKMGLSSMSMALSDFYASTNDSSHKRRLVLHIRDSNKGVVDAASQAIDLLNIEVQAIIGPLTSLQALMMVEIGNKAQVPIISFTSTSPFVSSFQNPYFIRTAIKDSSQVQAIAAIVKGFGWREVVPIYEDTEYGNGIIPYLTDALQEIDTRVSYRSPIPPSATNDQILDELYKLMAMQTRVFFVHMTPSLGLRVFQKAKMIGMMSEGYAWIITDGLANFLNSFNSSIIDSMQGVLGVRPYVPESKELDTFRVRWKNKFLQENTNIETADLNIFCLWAYDTIWALATAIQKFETTNSVFSKQNVVLNSTSHVTSTLGVSQIGPELLQGISKVKFRGLSGEFSLVDRQLKSDAFQILNVVGLGGREVGIWTPSTGITRDLNFIRTRTNSDFTTSKDRNLRAIIWPGESTVAPKGWVVPKMGKKLRIGVPVKRGFKDFVRVTRNDSNNSTYVTGYSIDVFKAVIEMLPYPVPYEFIPFQKADGTRAGSYDDLIYQVYVQNFDAVVGDVTIIAKRSLYVDFTLPYTTSGFSMIVPVKVDPRKNIWILLQPLTTELWIKSAAFFVLTGIVIWVLEHQVNNEFRGTLKNQLVTMFWFFFSTPAFADKEKVLSFSGRCVVIIWSFVLLMLSSSYTASLSSMLTVHRLEPTVTDVHELIKNRNNVGYLEGSFVCGMLQGMGFDRSNLKPYKSPEDFKEAFSSERKDDQIVAAFDEVPYINLLLERFCDQYTMVGKRYKTAGFGFAFPRGSPLVPDISRAILNLREGDQMTRIEQAWFGNKQNCQDPNPWVSSTSLPYESFEGLFIGSGVLSILAVLVFLFRFLMANYQEILVRNVPIWQRVVALFINFYYQERPRREPHDAVVPLI